MARVSQARLHQLVHLGAPHILVVLRWTLQRGIVVIPRTASPAHLVENLSCADARFALTDAEMAELDGLNEAHPYYWSPMPCQPPGAPKDV